ncbi:hypothetical protein [uncultured Algimonas sp.]|uniref:hypothetical protein n=1 Tax=uncultured Algimonas sp. TaxID=1547920 RepID=UPI00263A39FB|nr:hypothetical protein [uncultured Algimonas sp.]
MPIPAAQDRTRPPTRLNRRVLVVTDNVDGSVALIGHLRALGLDVSLSAYDGTGAVDLPDRSPSAALCFLSDYVEHGTDIVARIRNAYAPRDFPVLGRLMREAGDDHPYDSVLYDPVHAVQVAQRLYSLIRLGQMEAEIIRRQATLRDSFGQDFELADTPLRQPFRVLFIGKADPAYMAVVNALQDKNVDVIAAFTSFSAFDYLHESSFDAVVINARHGSEPAMTIAETMRRNPQLFHVPTLLLVNGAEFREADVAYSHGIKDVIDAEAPLFEVSGRILELANDCRIHRQLKDEFDHMGGPDCSDPETGVMNARFLEPHLRRVSHDCRRRGVPLGIMTLKLTARSTADLPVETVASAYAQSVRTVSGVVRMQDIVARMDRTSVIIAFPEENRQDVARIAARIKALIETSTFPQIEGAGLRMGAETAIMMQDDAQHAPNPRRAPGAMTLAV